MWLEIEPGDRADWLTRQSMETTILIALKRLIANHEDIDEADGRACRTRGGGGLEQLLVTDCEAVAWAVGS
ncbi:hypothetical protein [Dokdonella sp.]|uniref:hypothetical protein n=1 Tax=Dokdonella sp. TaxID=2291710 RepID=UPI003529C413